MYFFFGEPNLSGPGRPKTYLNVRVDAAVKQQLEQLAASEGLDLPNYLRKHYQELVSKNMISPEEDIRIPNPVTNPYPYGQPYAPAPSNITPSYPYPYYPQMYPSPYATPVVAPDAIDQAVNEMRKLVVFKMFKEILQEKGSPEDVIRAAKGDYKKSDDLSMQDIMKMQMLQAQIDKQYQQQTLTAQQQLELARGKGDKAGENQALQLLTALSTAQMQQQQNFMQQFMLAQTNSANVQQTLFNTALQTNRASEDAARQERSEFQQQVENVRTDLAKTQIQSLQDTNKLNIDFLNRELERIRLEPHKDVITQLGELLNLRSTNPVYKAAFDAAFGVKEGGIGDLIPKLKELGVDKVIDKVASALSGLIVRPPPGAIPTPTPPMPTGPTTPTGVSPTAQIPAPLPAPNPQELESLRLPPTGNQPVPSGPPPSEVVAIEKPDNIGYSNLEAFQGKSEEIVKVPTPIEQEPQITPEEQHTPVQQPQEESRSFTTGRKPGSKNKSKEPQ